LPSKSIEDFFSRFGDVVLTAKAEHIPSCGRRTNAAVCSCGQSAARSRILFGGDGHADALVK